MQLFRLMGMPDKMIAFNELPAELLEGLEMSDESRMPRHWREFIGLREKYIRIPPDRDHLTGAVRQYQPIIQKAPFTYVIDREINKDQERWQEIQSYVRRTAPKDFRLLDKLEDMAKPMAPDAHSEVTLEPEQVPIIPLSVPVTATENFQSTVAIAPVDPAPQLPADVASTICAECGKGFDNAYGLQIHTRRMHKKVEA